MRARRWSSLPREFLSALPFVPVLAALLFFGAMFWAKGRDPFQRIWFDVRPGGYPKTECVAVLPKTAPRPLPVVIYLHGSGGSLLGSGNELRQMAEMGLAAVGMEYDQTNAAVSAAQWATLLRWIRRQSWADSNRVAWVGFSLGAQRQLAFALEHPEAQPNLLVRLSGGSSPELEDLETARAATPRFSSLLIHGERDEVFPLAEARRVAGWLRTNGVPVQLKVVPGLDDGLQPNRLLLCRSIGEYCLLHLSGPNALMNYRSILSWQAHAKPLWLFWTPGLIWTGFRLFRWWSRRRAADAAGADGSSAGGAPPWTRGQIAIWCAAGILALAALADTALHLLPPRLGVTARTLSLARKYLVLPKQSADFDFAARDSVWRGKRLRTLLENVELANYNRELIDWKLDDKHYRDFVLSPEIDPALDGDLEWRRPLWENFYPRIRNEPTPGAAAEIVARFLRERVTIAPPNAQAHPSVRMPQSIARIWQRQITDTRGFESIYVAALRAAGVPARLDPGHRAEFWTGSRWEPAPRPVFDQWD